MNSAVAQRPKSPVDCACRVNYNSRSKDIVLSGHVCQMTYQFYMGLTKMADMNCFAAADFFSSSGDSAGSSSAKKKLRGDT